MATDKKKNKSKKKPKVTLNKKRVTVLAAVIVAASILCLVLNIVLSRPAKNPAAEKPQVAQTQTQNKPSAETKDEKPSGKTSAGTTESQQKQEKKETSQSQKNNTQPQQNTQAQQTNQSQPSQQTTTQQKQGTSQPQQQAAQTQSAKQTQPAQSAQNTPAPQNSQNNQHSSASQQTQTTKPAQQSAQPAQSTSGSQIASAGKIPQGDSHGIEEAKKHTSKFDFPEAKNSAVLCFVLDDAGENPSNVKAYTSLKIPLTIAVLPRVSHSRECADIIRASGKEIILHQPMQAKNLSMNPGAGAITGDMMPSKAAETIRENLRIVGPVKGMNNHEGSLITSDQLKMIAVLELCMDSNVYFIDSRTALPQENQVKAASLQLGYDFLERNAPFLDNVVSRDEILKQIYEGVKIANRDGYAIMIGHVDKSVKVLPQLFQEIYPELIKKGYRIATPSTLL